MSTIQLHPPEVLPPTTDLRTFLLRLHRLSEDARHIEWPDDPLVAMNAAALVEILQDRMRQRNAQGHISPPGASVANRKDSE